MLTAGTKYVLRYIEKYNIIEKQFNSINELLKYSNKYKITNLNKPEIFSVTTTLITTNLEKLKNYKSD